MSNDYFKFKQFTVRQDKCAMKVGTDGVLLGAWIRARGDLRILDIGTGTGLISLMLAQKTTGQIDAVELDLDAAQQATENFKSSPWFNRIHCFHQPVQDFAIKPDVKYDMVVSNPPFFNAGMRSDDLKRAQARHTDSLTLKNLVELAAGMLTEKGRLGIVLPYELRESFIKCISLNGLWVEREARIRPLPDANFVRIMFEVRKRRSNNYHIEEIVIEEGGRHKYASTFKNYTIDFYLEQHNVQ